MKNIFSFFRKKKSATNADVNADNFLQEDSILVGYSNINEQIITYSTALTFFNTKQTILDVGCGRGDLFAFLKEEHEDVFLDSNYYGIDYNPVIIESGKSKYGIDNIHVKDFNSFTLENKYNWVIACNFFNAFNENQYDYLYNCIDKMYNLCNIGIAFNVITNQADITIDQENLFSTYDQGKILNHISLTYKKVVVRSDYLLGDTTYFIFKS